MKDLFSVSGKVALVTGATSGIGLMIAQGLVQAGARVYLTARHQESCEALAERLSTNPGISGEAISLPGDISTPQRISSLARGFAGRESSLDILVNNAGISIVAPFEDFRVEDWDAVFDVNLKAAFFLTKTMLPFLRSAASQRSPARVVNIGSIGGIRVGPRENYSYGASKAGLHHITRVLAKRLGADHITVNAIAPGFFPSRITDTAPEIERAVVAGAPLGRVGEASDIAAAVIYLCGRSGAYVTGVILPVDGGFSL